MGVWTALIWGYAACTVTSLPAADAFAADALAAAGFEAGAAAEAGALVPEAGFEAGAPAAEAGGLAEAGVELAGAAAPPQALSSVIERSTGTKQRFIGGAI